MVLFIYKTPNITASWPRIFIRSPFSPPSNDTKTTNQARRFAIFSSSIHSTLRSYIFYTPITAAAWQRIGYEVIVIFVGDFTKNTNALLALQLNLSRTLLQQLGVHIIDFQCNSTYSIKMSQLVRIFTGYLNETIIKDEDYILTTDSDIIPIRTEDYQLKENTTGFIYNAFCCGSFKRREKTYQMYPLSHICLPKKIWRDLFLKSIQREELLKSNLTSFHTNLLSEKAPFSFETISLYTRHEFGPMYDSNMIKGDSAWYMDQVYSSMLINDYCEKYRNIRIDKRYKTSKRLDPSLPYHMWEKQRLKEYGDAHIIHDEIFDSYRWAPFKNLLAFLFDSILADDFYFYYKQFTLTLKEPPKEF